MTATDQRTTSDSGFREGSHGPPPAAPRTSAWGLSLAIHVVVLVALALLVRGVVPAAIDEHDRAVGIVLAHVAEETVDYVTSESSASEASADSQPVAAALPAAEALEVIERPNIELPGLNVPVPADVSVVEQPALKAGGRPRFDPNAGVAEILADERERQRRAAAVGPPTSVTLFGGAPAVGRSFIFVIDRSKSMGEEGLGAVAASRDELGAALQALGPTHKFQIIAYHHQRVFFQDRPELIAATDPNKNLVSRFFGGLAAFGGTNHEMALTAAMRFNPDVIYLLTDGGDPGLSEPQMADVVHRARGRTTIHCVQFGFGPLQDTNNFMQRLSRETGGGYGYVNMSGR